MARTISVEVSGAHAPKGERCTPRNVGCALVSKRRQPPQQPPPVQRLRFRYAKRGRARFASHRDFGRAFERALRRAEVPMAYSSGFHPHPRISYVNAAPTGAASEAEYLEIGLAEEREPESIMAALNAAMPDGLVMVQVAPADGGSLADRLGASRWQILMDGASDRIASALDTLSQSEEVFVERKTKSRVRRFNVSPAVADAVAIPGGCEVTLVAGGFVIRPDDVVAALRILEPVLDTGTPALFTRLAQGPWDGNHLSDPLA